MDEKSKVTQMPAAPVQQIALPPELLAFVAYFDVDQPDKIHFVIGDSMVGPKIAPGVIHNLLGEVRTAIRRHAAAKGNTTLAEGL